MKIAVAIATTGRPKILSRTLGHLVRQTRPADRILVVGAAHTDLPDWRAHPGVRFALAAKGSCKQRNRAIDMLDGAFDIILFLDDDFFVAKDFIAGVERLMRDNPDVVAASGHLLADGVRSRGISIGKADHLIAGYEAGTIPAYIVEQPGAYGCNMIVRAGACRLDRFDEDLPLFGWLEDLDLSVRLATKGRIVRTSLCVGVHLAAKSGRSPGSQLGYSQLANPFHLVAKGSMRRQAALWMATKNVIANALKSVAPEPYIDRRGRLRGNLLALADLVTGRIHPTRVLEIASGPALRNAPATKP